MNEPTLRERVEELLQFALNRTAKSPALGDLNGELRRARERLEQPMRVAIVGLIKAGKSTTMNALLGEAVVAMGTVETTFNVNWLRYGAETSLIMYYKDNRPPEPKSFAELEALTRRADENREYLRSIKYIVVSYPNPILEIFNLIDTPGLASYHEEDSQNTRAFIKAYGQELTEATETEASNADAVLYLFSQSIATTDQATVEQFQGPAMGDATPINSIGVLTKADVYWPARPEPLAAGRQITSRLWSDHPQVRSLFYTISPLCGLLALGARTLTPDEFSTLTQLAALPEHRFERLVRYAGPFVEREYQDVPISAVHRQQVLARLGQYGIWLACQLIRGGLSDRERLKNELLERSGLPELRDLIVSHFGNRAFLIKLDTALRQIAAACFLARQRLNGADRQIAGEIGGKFEEVANQEHAFRELRVLRSYYERKLPFDPDEVQQLLQVTGEYGTLCHERLGLDSGSTVEEVLAQMFAVTQERIRYWRRKAIDPGSNSETIDAADVLAHSYERIAYHVNQASKHLSLI